MKAGIVDISYFREEENFQKWFQKMTPVRQEKIERCKSQTEKSRSLAAGYLETVMLKEAGIRAEDVCWNENGSPECRDVFFSLSHSGSYAACITGKTPVGIDIQEIRRLRENVVRRCLTLSEWEQYEQLPGEKEKSEFFHFCWSCKESWMKLTGEGMKAGFQSVAFCNMPKESRPDSGAEQEKTQEPESEKKRRTNLRMGILKNSRTGDTCAAVRECPAPEGYVLTVVSMDSSIFSDDNFRFQVYNPGAEKRI